VEFDIDYEVVQALGEGGFGRVVLVRNRKRNVQFAMKELTECSPDMYREVSLFARLFFPFLFYFNFLFGRSS
jgi:serine/threonine protein kinase